MESDSVAFEEGGYWNSMEFNADGTIRRVQPTHKGVAPVKKINRKKY